MNGTPRESDWKVYRKRVGEWRERYLAHRNREVVAVLSDENRTPTERFWDAKAMMEDEARILVDCLDHHARSAMRLNLMLMYRHGLVRDDDLDEFSAELHDHVRSAVRDGPG